MPQIPVDLFARVALSPLLVAQALNLRRTAMKLPEAAGPRQGVRGHGPDLRLLLVGDSSAAGVGAATQNQALIGHLVDRLSDHYRVTWQVEAETGATTRSTLARLKDRPIAPCDVVIVALGVNDATRLIPARVLLRQNRNLLDWLRDRTGAKAIHVSGLPPLGDFPLLPQPLRWTLGRHARKIDDAMRQAVPSRGNCTYVGFDSALDPRLMAEDGFHPGPELYRQWGRTLAEGILSEFNGPSRQRHDAL